MNDPNPESIPPISSSVKGTKETRIIPWLQWSALFLLIWCVKLWVIRIWGSSVPFGDEWSGEAASVLKPYLEKTLHFSDLFAPCNEHRIFTARLFYLAMFKLNGLWDPGLQMTVQALLHAASIVLFLFLCTRDLTPPLRSVFMLATCPLWILPFGWENTLFGFQSQFYFVMLFGITTIWLTWRHETLTRGWWAGVLVAVAGLFTMASGLFAPVVAAGLVLGRVWLKPAEWRRHMTGFAVLAVIVVIGFLLIPNVAHGGPGKAQSIGEMLGAWLLILSWPQNGHWLWIILQAPLVLLTLQVIRKRLPMKDGAWLLLALGAWGLIQALALAYGRARLTPVAPRYTDVFVLTLCASFACFCRWFMDVSWPSGRRCWMLCAGGAWMFVLLHGAFQHFISVTVPELDHWAQLTSAQENTVREYLETHDPTLLSTKPIPFVNADELRLWLDDSTIADILPTSIRPVLSSTRTMTEDSFFTRSYFAEGGSPTPDQQRYWSSYGPEGPAQHGEMELKFPGAKRSRLMEFFVAGAPNAEGMSLELTDKSGRTTKLAPHQSAGMQWRSMVVRIPQGIFSIKAKDENADQWLAVSNPREVGLASYYLGGFIQASDAAKGGLITMPLLAATAAVLWLLTLLLAAPRRGAL